MSNSLEGYCALVTGGGTGLGRSHARVMASRGAKVAVTDYKQENLDACKAALKKEGLDVVPILADNRVVAEVKAAAAQAEKALGKVDILVNNAGVSGMHAHIEEVDEKRYDDMVDTHVKGAFFMTQAVVPGMKQRKFGRIINTGSVFAMNGHHSMSHYGLAKGALTAVARTWARELGAFGVTVNTVSPGLVITPMTEEDLTPELKAKIISGMLIGRTIEPVEISYVVAFLASREADAITGQNFSPNGGQAIVGI